MSHSGFGTLSFRQRRVTGGLWQGSYMSRVCGVVRRYKFGFVAIQIAYKANLRPQCYQGAVGGGGE